MELNKGDMFDSLPETILDELCMQYNLDEDDREVLEFYLELPEDAKTAIKKTIKKVFKKE